MIVTRTLDLTVGHTLDQGGVVGVGSGLHRLEHTSFVQDCPANLFRIVLLTNSISCSAAASLARPCRQPWWGLGHWVLDTRTWTRKVSGSVHCASGCKVRGRIFAEKVPDNYVVATGRRFTSFMDISYRILLGTVSS